MNSIQTGKLLVAIGLFLVLIAIGVFVKFFFYHDVSSDVNDWGAFGSYLSGAIGAPISILALVGAVIAIHQQNKTDKKVINHSLASDLVRSIERLEDTLDKDLSSLPITVHYPDCGFSLETDALRILIEFNTTEIVDKVIPKFTDDHEVLARYVFESASTETEQYNRVRLYEVYVTGCGKIRLMRDLINQHKDLVGHNVLALYYKNKYKRAVSRLNRAGYPVDLWDDIERIKG